MENTQLITSLSCILMYSYLANRVHTFHGNIRKNILLEQTSDAIDTGSWSIRTRINSYSSQFVLTLANSYSCDQFVLMPWLAYSIWSSGTHFGQFVLSLKRVRLDQNENQLTKLSMSWPKLVRWAQVDPKLSPNWTKSVRIDMRTNWPRTITLGICIRCCSDWSKSKYSTIKVTRIPKHKLNFKNITHIFKHSDIPILTPEC